MPNLASISDPVKYNGRTVHELLQTLEEIQISFSELADTFDEDTDEDRHCAVRDAGMELEVMLGDVGDAVGSSIYGNTHLWGTSRTRRT